MKIFRLYGAAALLAAASLASCVKDTLYNTPHPDKGAVVVQTDWSNLLPEAVAQNYVINVDGTEQTVSGTSNTVKQLQEPGTHTILIYNRPEGIAVSGDVASVDEAGSRADGGEGGINPLPGYLFSRFETVTVATDDTLRIVAKPVQWVRQLNIKLSVADGDYSRVSSVTAALGGVERSVDIRKSVRMGTAATVRNEFAVTGGKFDVSFRLMGIVPAAGQTLTVEIVFGNGDTQTVTSDLSTPLESFNGGIEPVTLTGELHLPVGGGISANIDGWEIADSGNEDAYQ